MRTFLLSLFFAFLTFFGFAQVSVHGYYRSDGTYVQPHIRSSPDHNLNNNYSYPGNTNPSTGKVATGNPEIYLKNYHKSNGGSYGDSNNNLPVSDYISPSSSTYPTRISTPNQQRNFFGDIMTKEEIENENKTQIENHKENEKFLKEFENRNKTISYPKIPIKNNLGKKQGYLKLIEVNLEFKTYQL